jgi:hypothetical protein
MLLAIPLVFAFIEPSSALPLILEGVTRRSRDGMNVISSGYSLVTASFFSPFLF